MARREAATKATTPSKHGMYSHHSLFAKLRVTLIRAYGMPGDRIRVPRGVNNVYPDPDYLMDKETGTQVIIAVSGIVRTPTLPPKTPTCITAFAAHKLGEGEDMVKAAHTLAYTPADQGFFRGLSDGTIIVATRDPRDLKWQQELDHYRYLAHTRNDSEGSIETYLYTEHALRMLYAYVQAHFSLHVQ